MSGQKKSRWVINVREKPQKITRCSAAPRDITHSATVSNITRIHVRGPAAGFLFSLLMCLCDNDGSLRFWSTLIIAGFSLGVI